MKPLRLLFMSVLTLVLSTLAGCGSDSVAPALETDFGSLNDAIVRANCLTVQAAAEEFARMNDGIYPGDTNTSTTPCGSTLVAFLPNGAMLLQNPWTTYCSEPSDGVAGWRGQTCYMPQHEFGFYWGYKITGVGGQMDDQFFRLSNLDSPDAIAKKNLVIVRLSLWYYHWYNDLEFPASISDTTTSGVTMDSLTGPLPPNPYTGAPVRLVDGPPSHPGDIGYEKTSDGVRNYAAKVSVAGRTPGDIIASYRMTVLEEEAAMLGWCDYLDIVANEFARMNDGRYPTDLTSDVCSEGYTVLQRLGGLVVNSFTGSHTEPRLGRAVNPGEIGYEPLGDGLGYRITLIGKRGEVIREFSKMLSPADAAVNSNCAKLGKALCEFAAQNGGIFPRDAHSDAASSSGKTLLNLLPGGVRLMNSVTGYRTEPRNHPAASPGQVGWTVDTNYPRSFAILSGVGESGAYIYYKILYASEPNKQRQAVTP